MESDCIYHYPIDFKPNRITFGSKWNGEMVSAVWFRLIWPDSDVDFADRINKPGD